jgi:glycosyltransferase involved in cell wall biosynthesis
MKKRILILTSTFPRWKNDSTPPFVFYLARHLEKHFQVLVLTPHFPGAKNKEKFGQIIVYRFHYFLEKFEKLCYEGGGFSKIRSNYFLSLLLPFYFITAFVSTLILVKKNKIELINAHWVLPQGLAAVMVNKLTGVPVLITSHGTDIFGLNNWLFVRLKKFTLENAGYVFAVAEELKKEILKISGKTRNKIKVISMGVEVDYFRRMSQKQRQSVKKRYGSKRKIILFVGRLVKNKGLKYLFEAMVKTLREIPSALLLVIGEGPYRQELGTEAERLALESKVSFLGWVDNQKLPGFYGAAEVFVSPSIETESSSEGLPVTIMEALASGVAVVGTSVGGIKEVIRNNQNGFLVPSADSSKLARAIVKILSSVGLRKRFEKNSQQLIKERFDWSVIETEYKKRIDKMIS